jgi:molecular chaperone DnaK
MPSAFAGYFKNQGLKVVENSLTHVVGKPASYVKDEANYRLHVIQPGWNALPLTIRLLMKGQFTRWDQLYHALWTEVLDWTGPEIQLVPGGAARIAALGQSHLGGDPPEPVQPVPQAEPVAAEETAALASVAPPVGIDLGTTYSVIAYVDAQGRPCTLSNGDGERLTPSVVFFGAEGTVVGKQALQGSALEPERTALCVKRDMGAKSYRHKINGEFMPPEVISSCILRSLKSDAERALGRVSQAVITVPAYFDETRRRATIDAGKLAGLDVLDIINEPTAAAIAYGYQLGFLDTGCQLVKGESLRVLVYDLGGGTFDVTIVEIGKSDFRALATDGDVYLGGRDWDERLVKIAAERFRSQFRDDPRDNPSSAQELWLAAETAKRTLTERPKATLSVNHLGSRCKIEVSRDEFEQASADLVERTRLTTEIVIRQAGLTLAEIERVLLVGGATRMPMIVRMLVELTGKVPERSISPDEAVAHGAALYAQSLAPTDALAPGFSVTDVNAHSLGILGTDPASGKQFNKVLIPKNTPLPHTVVKKFQTFRHGQRAILIKVLEGESDKPILCASIGVCTIGDLPADLPAGWPIEVVYTYQSNGQLSLSAKLKDYDKSISTEFQRENSLPDEDLELWAQVIENEFFAAPG